MKNLKLFITGGTGVLGKRVIPLLHQNGHDLGILSRSEENSKSIKKMGAKPIKVDLFNEKSINQAVSEYEGILHLATAIPRKNRTSAKDWDINTRIRLEGTTNLVNAVLKFKMKFLILQSVTFAYGHRDGEWVDESILPTIPVPNAVKISKEFQNISDSNIIMENLFRDQIQKLGLPGIILRFGWFYSYDSANIPGMVERKFPLTGDGEAYWNLINVDDAAVAITKTVKIVTQILETPLISLMINQLK